MQHRQPVPVFRKPAVGNRDAFIMATWVLVLLIILIVIIAAGVLRVIFEVTHPEIKRYLIRTQKLSANEKVRITFIADLHSRTYGKNNVRLLQMISRTKPDFIVLGGDMITASSLFHKDERTINTLDGLTNIAPVYYIPGNHEKKLSENPKQTERYEDYMFELECMDVTWLADQEAVLTEEMYIHGLDIESRYYRHFRAKPQLTPEIIYQKLGVPDRKKFNILVAHTPEFFDAYVNCGYDLVLCGHYHGGTIILPEIGPLISPDLKFRPEHSGGAYRKSGTNVIVTRGIGSHLVNIRLFNRPEIVVIDIRQEEKAEKVSSAMRRRADRT